MIIKPMILQKIKTKFKKIKAINNNYKNKYYQIRKMIKATS